MSTKPLPFGAEVFHEIAEQYGTPVYVYDEVGIRANAQEVNTAFSWSPDHVNYFAVKAAPTSGILRVVASEGMGLDCSSLTELTLVQRSGLGEAGLFYSSNNTPDNDYRFARDLGATINLDKAIYLDQVVQALDEVPSKMAIRYNPGPGRVSQAIIGEKFGDTEEHILSAFATMASLGVEHIGLHAMVATNETVPEHFGTVAKLVRQLAERATEKAGVEISFINIGGGVGIDYRPTDSPVDIRAIGEAVESQLSELDIPVVSELGRFIVGPHGSLLTGVTHGIVSTHKDWLTVDTSVNNMARLASNKDAWHELTVLGREDDPRKIMTVVGSMCVDTDSMFKDRLLPATTQPGDLLVIHDAGGHGRANATNYNGKVRAGEVMVHPDGTHHMMRRHETIDDVLVTDLGLIA